MTSNNETSNPQKIENDFGSGIGISLRTFSGQ